MAKHRLYTPGTYVIYVDKTASDMTVLKAFLQNGVIKFTAGTLT